MIRLLEKIGKWFQDELDYREQHPLLNDDARIGLWLLMMAVAGLVGAFCMVMAFTS